MRVFLTARRKEGLRIGFVPTMGFLHTGHISLVAASKKENDITVVSIFVNPTQFAPNEDFNRYPRDLDRDKAMLAEAGTDVVFIPDAGEMYPPGSQTYVSVEKLSQLAEGEFRPTHFKGVATVVTMLFNIVQPDRAYFGQKDAQQTAVIRRMVKDLHMPVDVVVCPILREVDGIAMSSRNIFLSAENRVSAQTLSKSLTLAKEMIMAGERETAPVIERMKLMFVGLPEATLDYIRIVDVEHFLPINTMLISREYFIIIACKVGSTRLIDNVLISIESDAVRMQ